MKDTKPYKELEKTIEKHLQTLIDEGNCDFISLHNVTLKAFGEATDVDSRVRLAMQVLSVAKHVAKGCSEWANLAHEGGQTAIDVADTTTRVKRAVREAEDHLENAINLWNFEYNAYKENEIVKEASLFTIH